jgi:hypothetical protein
MGIANALNVRQKRGLPNVHKTAADVSLLKMYRHINAYIIIIASYKKQLIQPRVPIGSFLQST